MGLSLLPTTAMDAATDHLPTTTVATSVAGLYPIPSSGRVVYNFSQGWRFHLGDAEGAHASTFDDSRWQVVNVPHTPRLDPY